MKYEKTYQQLKDESIAHYDSILKKYCAASVQKGDRFTAKPPPDHSYLPKPTDIEYRRYAFLVRNRWSAWPKSERKYQ